MTYTTGHGMALKLTPRQFAARIAARYRLARKTLKMGRRDALRFALPA